MTLFDNTYSYQQNLLESTTLSKDVTYSDAKNDRLHRWYPYLEGYSEKFIQNVLKNFGRQPQTIFEPFAGTGTVPVYCQKQNIHSIYSEVNPFLRELIDLKLVVLQLNKLKRNHLIVELKKIYTDLLNLIRCCETNNQLITTYKASFEGSIYFNEKNLENILRFSTFINQQNRLLVPFLRIAGAEALLPSSNLKRNGDIRFKKTPQEIANTTDFVEKVQRNLWLMIDDLINCPVLDNQATVQSFENAKTYNENISNLIDCIITSPPYLNGTNYIRNTKLELWFLGYLTQKSELAIFRKAVVTSGINDVTAPLKKLDLESVHQLTANEALKYDQRIPKMINDYFYDMNLVIEHAFKYLKSGGMIFMDIGDSIYANVHVPTDIILMELFKKNGFHVLDNVLLRGRRSKNGDALHQTLIIATK